jgi:transposase/transposase-like protein
MRPPTPVSESRIAELREFRKAGWSGMELRRFLCVWLRVERGTATKEIATAAGRHVNTVGRVQKDFADNGVPALAKGRGGGRMHQDMAPGEEAEFLAGFPKAAAGAPPLVVRETKAALEARLGREVHETTVYRMLKRHGWRKVAPRPRHPKQDPKTAGAFKKGEYSHLDRFHSITYPLGCAMPKCKNCGPERSVKNGKARGRQRHRCADYGCSYVEGDARTNEKIAAKRAMLVLLYSPGKAPFNMLARLFDMWPSQVYRWVAKEGLSLPD